ncbi:hypothetical protein K439DRAFT_1623019 [Ramaria rubella]|nr:hypothetical protein K439DRAFT_1623019 [Ramaria rubella]
MSIPFTVSKTFTVAEAKEAGFKTLETHLLCSWNGVPKVNLDPKNIDIKPTPKGDDQLVSKLGTYPSFTYWPLSNETQADSPMASQISTLRCRELIHDSEQAGSGSATQFITTAPLSHVNKNSLKEQMNAFSKQLQQTQEELKQVKAMASVQEAKALQRDVELNKELARISKEQLQISTIPYAFNSQITIPICSGQSCVAQTCVQSAP